MKTLNISTVNSDNTTSFPVFRSVCKAAVVMLFTVVVSSCDTLLSCAADTAADAATYAANYNYSSKSHKAAMAQRALQNY